MTRMEAILKLMELIWWTKWRQIPDRGNDINFHILAIYTENRIVSLCLFMFILFYCLCLLSFVL